MNSISVDIDPETILDALDVDDVIKFYGAAKLISDIETMIGVKGIVRELDADDVLAWVGDDKVKGYALENLDMVEKEEK